MMKVMMKFWQLLVHAHCPPSKVLIIDDDDALRETLKEQFTLHDEFAITDAATASAGLKQLRSEMVDLVLLDVQLPDMDGREACKQMRKIGYRGPIVMLTAQDTEADTILGLESGANDYIAKPFRFGVLLARVRAQLRQLVEPDDTPTDDDDDDDLLPPDRAAYA
jgi:DNA-binding response OmpR family regulator